MTVADNLKTVRNRIAQAAGDANRSADEITLVAVSKTFGQDDIVAVIDAGQRVFGENRVQEAQSKWPELKRDRAGIELHLIGPLQSNKTQDAVALFDVIETVDREKIAKALAAECRKQNRHPSFYVQVNTGSEPQKAGIEPRDAAAFVKLCGEKYGLEIEGLMCIPPVGENPGPHFALLAKIASQCGLSKLSMGMSADFDTAVAFGATSVRVGSAIFGVRPQSGAQNVT